VTSLTDALAKARALGVDRLDAQLLLGHVVQRPRTWLIAHGDDELSAADATAYGRLLERRAEGEPLAYLVGEREFHGLSFAVSPAVLVPRPDTEVLVDWALELMADHPAPRVLDLGTGSGAIAVTLAHRHRAAHLLATDCSAEALAVARGNAARHQVKIEFLQANWWEGLAGRRFDGVVSNPPYIAGEDPHLPALRHEPRLALTPGGDGLDALRCIVAGAAAHLVPGGWLLLEHGHDQGPAVRQLLCAAGFAEVETRRDLAGLDRCTGGRGAIATAG
jgi:release factor glutamine methyltransferase